MGTHVPNVFKKIVFMNQSFGVRPNNSIPMQPIKKEEKHTALLNAL